MDRQKRKEEVVRQTAETPKDDPQSFFLLCGYPEGRGLMALRYLDPVPVSEDGC